MVHGQQRACMPVYIGKSGDFVGWHRCLTHSQTENRATQLVSISWVMPEYVIFPLLHLTQWLIRLKTPKNSPGLRLVPFFGKVTSRVTTKKLKIRQRALFELGPFFSLFLMRKTLSSGQKWFLRPYFPLIRDMFLLRSGLRFSFRALSVRALPVPETKI